ncbi:hypothetical protein [Paenibacillus brasilensis]|uniref:Uncharacterized protein n=1 Tax=Paenibacillus brasilensis TaxID=128574 RepID=A0ABU0L0G0_9BACL|nr:hypothetical protein [Paenibacillus brasilensis]MDQ0495163.1 hypothetical protein [Paenibacillus brasilensis]
MLVDSTEHRRNVYDIFRTNRSLNADRYETVDGPVTDTRTDAYTDTRRNL